MLNSTRNPAAARLLLFLLRNKVPVLARLWGIVLGCDIGCKLPRSLIMPHPYGIVLHTQAVIGEGVVIMQQVTVGARNIDDQAPVIEDDVFIGAGAKVLGGIRIGRKCVIGANAVVTRDFAPGSTVVGINQILRQDEKDQPAGDR
jgi:serine O-acetyltransferase